MSDNEYVPKPRRTKTQGHMIYLQAVCCAKLIMADINNYTPAKCFLARRHSSDDESGEVELGAVFVSVTLSMPQTWAHRA